MAKVVSNKKQLERLVQLMSENENIAKGICAKNILQEKWELFALELNGLGPPRREWQKWQRVWADMKCKIKKKKMENKTEITSTGGGPNRLHHFSDMEEAVIQLMEMNTCVDPPGREFGFEGEEVGHDVSTNTVDMTDNDNLPLGSVEEQHKKTRKAEHKNASIVEERKNLLEEQTAAQKEFYKNVTSIMGDMKKAMRNIEHYTKKSVQQRDEIIKLKKEKLKAYKENKENERRDRKTKLELKIQMLELQKQKQGLMEFI